MITIIAGSRSATREAVDLAMAAIDWTPTAVACGCARGADIHGAHWANERDIVVLAYPADWKAHPRAAGMIRNGKMVAAAGALVAVWDGASRGTADVIGKARKAGLRVEVFDMEGARHADQP